MKNETKNDMGKLEDLGSEIVRFLQKNDLFHDVCLYVNNEKWASEKPKDESNLIVRMTRHGEIYITRPFNVKDAIEYCNPDTITMTFEGDLYELLNYGGSFVEEFSKICERWGYYYEQGHSWSLALYPIAEKN